VWHSDAGNQSELHNAPLLLQRHRRLAVWSISTHAGQGFVAVTPMRWPGGGGVGPRTPATQQAPGATALAPALAMTTGVAHEQLMSTPTGRIPAGGAGGGTYKK
jgi:hypothetical protein